MSNSNGVLELHRILWPQTYGLRVSGLRTSAVSQSTPCPTPLDLPTSMSPSRQVALWASTRAVIGSCPANTFPLRWHLSWRGTSEFSALSGVPLLLCLIPGDSRPSLWSFTVSHPRLCTCDRAAYLCAASTPMCQAAPSLKMKPSLSIPH